MNILKIKSGFKKAFRGLLIAVLVFSSVPLLTTANAAAETCDTVYYSANDILFYNPCETCSTSGTALIGGSNEEKVYTWLTGRGFNPAQAAGIMGNINTESSFNPFRMQTTYSASGIEAVLPIQAHNEYNKAFGLIQWDGGRRQQVLTQLEDKFPNFATSINAYGKSADGYKGVNGGEAGDEEAIKANDAYLAFELEFMYQELSNGYKSVFAQIQAQPNSEEGVVNSTEIWNRKFEVSGDYTQNRHNKAKEYYAQFKDATKPSAAGGQCSNGEPAGKVVWYSQTDTRWASIGYAGSNIGEVGCGPSAMAIILASTIDKNITPPDVAAVAGVQSLGTSSHANLIAGVKEKWGVNITSGITFNEAVEFVKSGKGYVWMGGGGPPPFTKVGHLVAMVGVTSDGQITIADPFGDGPGHQHIGNYPPAQIAAGGGSYYGVYKK